jgi:hypothetical protein
MDATRRALHPDRLTSRHGKHPAITVQVHRRGPRRVTFDEPLTAQWALELGAPGHLDGERTRSYSRGRGQDETR